MMFLNRSNKWDAHWTWFDAMREHGPRYLQDIVLNNDLFVFPRMRIIGDEAIQSVSEFFGIIQQMGKKIIYEVDDDYTNEHRYVGAGDAIAIAKRADAITVTTPYLAEVMNTRTKKKAYVLPNCFAPDDWLRGNGPTRRPEYEGKIMIGLTGSPSHEEDWKVLTTIMPSILRDYPNVMLLNMGHQPEYLQGLDGAIYIKTLPYEQYCAIIRGVDIILAPVDPSDGFNLGKSPLKATEGQAARRLLPNGQFGGAAVIATNYPIYQLAVEDHKTGLLVNQTPDQWDTAIRTLIENTELRQRLQVEGHRFVQRRFDMSKQWREWDRVYSKILR